MLYRMLCVFAACSLIAGIALADNKSTSDTKGLQGVWQAVDGEANGEQSPADQVEELHIIVKADEIAIKPDDEGRKFKFKLDPGKTPKTIDLTPPDGSHKGQPVVGIYSLENGRLRLCLNIFGADPGQRPTQFKTQAGDGVCFVTFERKTQEQE